MAPKFRSVFVTVIVVGVLILGALASVSAWREAEMTARRRDQAAADVAAAALSASFARSVESLRGASSMAVDGVVDDAEFAAYAAEILPNSLFRALAYSEIVPGSDLQKFAALTGLTVRDTDGAGGFRPAAKRDRHIVVVHVSPTSATTRVLLGFDIASDPVRWAATVRAATTAQPVLSDPIKLADSALPGIFAVEKVADASGRVVGFVTSGVNVIDVIAGDLVEIGPFGRRRLANDDLRTGHGPLDDFGDLELDVPIALP